MTFEEKRLKRLMANAGLPTPELGLPGAGPLKISPVFSPAGVVPPVAAPVSVPPAPAVAAAMPLPAAAAAVPQQSAMQEGIQNALLGFGLGATTESPIGAGIGAGLGVLGTVLNRRRKNPINLANLGAAPVAKTTVVVAPKKPQGMGAATRGHKQFD